MEVKTLTPALPEMEFSHTQPTDSAINYRQPIELIDKAVWSDFGMIPATSRGEIYPLGIFFTHEGAKRPSPKGHLKGSGERYQYSRCPPFKWASFVEVIKSFKADFSHGQLDHIRTLFLIKWLNL